MIELRRAVAAPDISAVRALRQLAGCAGGLAMDVMRMFPADRVSEEIGQRLDSRDRNSGKLLET